MSTKKKSVKKIIDHRKGSNKNFTDKQMFAAIKDSNAIMSVVADRLKCSWSCASDYVNSKPEYIQAWENEKESNLDLCESKLFASINKGDTQDAKWFLTRIGKNRGYAEKIEVDDVTDYEKQENKLSAIADKFKKRVNKKK
jgi:hypothetical protein